jgi:hypothetical protein
MYESVIIIFHVNHFHGSPCNHHTRDLYHKIMGGGKKVYSSFVIKYDIVRSLKYHLTLTDTRDTLPLRGLGRQ